MQATKEELAASFAAGVFLHLAVFRSGEWDAHSFTLLEAGAALQLALALCARQLFSEPAADALRHGLSWLGAGLAGLYASMLAYRALFHRLGGFPGPAAARLSTLHMTWAGFRRGQMFEDVRRLHGRYGDFVRVGPSELSITDPAAFAVIHSATSQCERGPWYNVLNPTVSVQMVRDRREHALRRKAWDRAFSNKALRDYEARVAGYTDELLRVFDREKGKSFNVSAWFNYYSFDIMGDLAFGQSFDLMKDGVDQYFYKTTHANVVLIGLFSRMIWLFPIVKATFGRWEYVRFQRFIKEVVERRRKNEPPVPDVFHWILEDFNQNPKPSWQETQNLYGDCSLIVVAGSDTAAATLTCLFYNLAAHPDAYRRLQEEVDAFFASAPAAAEGDLDTSALGRLEYLQACIDESLRLFPPVPSGLQRQTPPQGIQVGETFVPGNTIVMTPTYAMYRDPRTFPRGDEFIPERWTTKPELVKDASVYAPFSVGRFSCVGKQLALMEVRRVTTLLARRYDVAFAPGQTREAFLAGLRDIFTLSTPKLDLVFSPRR